jgi:DNA polymerase III subunit gamma/tau
MDISVQLNLARKWRSKNFDQIVGQDLAVKILKNSLYLNKFFPVYLFSGQRGCGKTSMARIFTAAINCDSLVDFQSNPRSFPVPCLECASCKAIAAGKHPDFIEIDAASYTGVDNVRQIIEASTLLPVMGKKKIYLIDEAHMLSKAAFNAFLKILEEPPPSVLFILATTDVDKIIDTVKSRCFQLFFDSISQPNLLGLLQKICKEEEIKFDDSGLKLIIRESEGSARDALNLLEQVRFSVSKVDKASVLSVLGYTSDENIEELFFILVSKKSAQELLQFIDKINFYKVAPIYIWARLLDLFKVAVRVKNGIVSEQINEALLKKVSYSNLLQAMEYICSNELVFLKTSNKHIFLETLFLRIVSFGTAAATQDNFQIEPNKVVPSVVQQVSSSGDVVLKKKVESSVNLNWAKFLELAKSEPLVSSVFVQAQFEEFSGTALKVSFDEKYIFFKELILDTKNIWQKLVLEVFGEGASLEYSFKTGLVAKEASGPLNGQMPKVASPESNRNRQNPTYARSSRPKSGRIEEQFDVSDKEQWIIANKLLDQFGGTIHEVGEEK